MLAISAHFLKQEPSLTSHPDPPTVHDLRGFPNRLDEMPYPAPGEPALAQQVAERITNTGMPAHLDRLRGLDHGAWTAIRLMGRGAEIPVVQLSLGPSGMRATTIVSGKRYGDPLRKGCWCSVPVA